MIECPSAPHRAQEADLDVLEAACARDPVCGCVWLGNGLLEVGEPAAHFRGIEVLDHACERGAIEGCDLYELQVALCLQQPALLPEWPGCGYLRAQGELPALSPPLTEAFGCHRSRSPLDPDEPHLFNRPHVWVCLAEDRISVRDNAGRWDQWRVEHWKHEDAPQQAVWVAEGVEGPSILVIPVEEPTLTYYVATRDGLLQVMLEAERDDAAERSVAALAPVEDVCRHADACEATPLPGSVREHEDVFNGEGESVIHDRPRLVPDPQTWRDCHRRWADAANVRLEGTDDSNFRPSLPPACGTVQTDRMLSPNPRLHDRVWASHVPGLVLVPPFASELDQQ
jgi:hypothetical protein